jgi:hypothetical protein
MNWPLALNISVVPVTVLVFKNSLMPVSMATGTIVKSLVSILPFAAIFHFLIMPYFDSFAELAPALAVMFFFMMYGMASPNPFLSLSSLLHIIVINILISVSFTPPTYGFGSFANIYIGLCGGLFLVLFLAYLFDTRNPRNEFLKLLGGICNELAGFFQDDRAQASPYLDDRSREKRHALLKQYKQLNQLYSVIRYRAKPGIQAREIEAIIDAAGTLIMQVIWVEMQTRSSDLRSFESATSRTWYSRTLVDIGCSLSKTPLITVIPFENGPARGRESYEDASVASKSLFDLISDFRRKLYAVDWEVWTRAYF